MHAICTEIGYISQNTLFSNYFPKPYLWLRFFSIQKFIDLNSNLKKIDFVSIETLKEFLILIEDKANFDRLNFRVNELKSFLKDDKQIEV